MKKVLFLAALSCAPGVHAQTDSIRLTELSEVVISSTRASERMPIAFTDLRVSDAGWKSVMPEIPAAIGLVPSVVMTSENGGTLGNQSFRIRGSDATRTNVTFDGVPVNDAESQAVFWVNMPDLMSSLQSLQIQRGVGTSTGGGAAFGATLNMQSVQPAVDPYAQASVAYGSFSTLKLNAAAGTGRSAKGWNADMRYSLGQTDGYVEHGGSDQQSLFFTGGYSSSRRIVKINVFHGSQHTDITWTGVPEAAMATSRRFNPEGLYEDSSGNMVRYDNETDNYRQTHIHLHYTEQPGEWLKLNTTLYYTRGKGYYEQYREDEDLSEYWSGNAGITDLTRRKLLDNDLWGAIATAAYTSDRTRAHLGLAGNIYSNRHFGDILWAEHTQLIPWDSREWHRNTGKKSDVSAFLKVTHRMGSRWYAFGDIQLRHISYSMTGIDDDRADISYRTHWRFFNPKAGLTFAVTPQQRAYLSVAVGHREPVRSDIKEALKAGNAANMPRPETLWDTEAGYTFSNSTWNIGANLFCMYYSDQLVNTGKMSDTGYALMENVSRSYRAGVELTLGIRPVKALQINANMAYSRNRIRDYTAYTDAYDNNWNRLPQREEHFGATDIAYSPEWVGAADVTYEIFRGLTVGMTAKYVGEQYYDNTSSVDRQLDAYFVNSALAGYRRDFGRFYAGVQLAVNNLWNADCISNAAVYRWDEGATQVVDRYFFPQPFRNFMAKLTVGF